MPRSNQIPWNHNYSLLLRVADDSNRLGMVFGISPVRPQGVPHWLGPNIASTNGVLAALKQIHAKPQDASYDANEPARLKLEELLGRKVTRKWIESQIRALLNESEWFSAAHFAPRSYVELAAAIFLTENFSLRVRNACRSYGIRDDGAIQDVYHDVVCETIATVQRRALIWYVQRNRAENNWFGRVSITIGSSSQGLLAREIQSFNEYRSMERPASNGGEIVDESTSDLPQQSLDQLAEKSAALDAALSEAERRKFAECLEAGTKIPPDIWKKLKDAASLMVDA